MVRAQPRRDPLVIAGLSLIGTGIAAYLWWTKAGAPLICGPFGNCAAVLASPYSEIGGVPVAAFGMLAYLAIAGAAVVHWRTGRTDWALAGFGIAWAGALFSLYLTGIEAFVLHAYCPWCLTSWVLITLIAVCWTRYLWHSARPRSAGSRP